MGGRDNGQNREPMLSTHLERRPVEWPAPSRGDAARRLDGRLQSGAAMSVEAL